MKSKDLIPLQQFCISHEIEFSFINSLDQSGLIEITRSDDDSYISGRQLKNLEKIVRLHYEMDINIEGIEAITHLLQRVDQLHDELAVMKTRLRFYEGD